MRNPVSAVTIPSPRPGVFDRYGHNVHLMALAKRFELGHLCIVGVQLATMKNG